MNEIYKTICKNTQALIASLPPGVVLVAAGKTRTIDELRAVIDGGITIIGHNYVQEAVKSRAALRNKVEWHMIGHLQRNKAKLAVELFDMVETVDSTRTGRALNQACAALHKTLPVLIEVNSGKEENKNGVLPEQVEKLACELAEFPWIKVQGLMTMGPVCDDSEAIRPYFRLTKKLFNSLIKLKIPGVQMRYLSMGMSASYLVAIEEGANLVRIGSRLFGPR